MDFYTLETFPCPQTKEYIENVQKICELFYSINQKNYLEILTELTPLVTNTIDCIRYLRTFCEICTDYSPRLAYYFFYVYSQIFLLLQNNNPNINPSYAYLSKNSPFYAFFAVFGIIDKNEFKEHLTSIDLDQFEFSLFIIATTLYSHSEIIILLLSNSSSENSDFVNFITNYYDDIRQIIKNEPVEKREDNENDIFLILYEDDLDAFIPYLNKRINDPKIKNPYIFEDSIYEFLSCYYNFSIESKLIFVATMLHANKIIKYLLEHQQTSWEMFNSLELVICRSDFEHIKLFSKYITFPQTSFKFSLLQPNPEIIKYVYEKSHFHFSNGFEINHSFYDFPYSIFFLLNHMQFNILPRDSTYMQSSIYIVYKYQNIINRFASNKLFDFGENLQDLFRNCPFGLELFEYALKKTHSCIWLLLIPFTVNQDDLLSDIIINVFKNSRTKVKKNLYETLFQSSSILMRIIQSTEFKVSDFDITIFEGLPLAFYIAIIDDSQLFDSMISKGYDVNNKKHPENASIIHFACISETITNLAHLLAVPGLDINRKDGYGRTAIDIAKDPSYRALLINAGCQSSKTQIIYNERDFINSNQLLHQHSIKGPAQYRTRKYSCFHPVIMKLQSQCFYKYSISTSLVCSDSTVFSLSRLYYEPRDLYEIGTKSKPVTIGPYNFGIIKEARHFFYLRSNAKITFHGIKEFPDPKNTK